MAKLKNIRFQQSGWKTGFGYITTTVKEELLMPDKKKGRNHKRAKVKKPPKDNGRKVAAPVVGVDPDKRKKATLAQQRVRIARKQAANG